MDIKISGITAQIMAEALDQAKRGRLHILDEMAKALPQARESISHYAPRILTIQVPVDKIRDIIGPGGKMIRSIVERTGCKIDVEDDGTVAIASPDGEAAQQAQSIIEGLTATAELNKTYLGTVQRLTDFGAFVEILPNTDGLLHISEVADYHVRDINDELREGQQILVKVINIDNTGRVRLSRKALIAEEGGGDGGGGGGRDRDRDRDDRNDEGDEDAREARAGAGAGRQQEGGDGDRGDNGGRRRRRRRRPGGGGGGGNRD
jgi:polyribonucleotide nucleotidyltransferase